MKKCITKYWCKIKYWFLYKKFMFLDVLYRKNKKHAMFCGINVFCDLCVFFLVFLEIHNKIINGIIAMKLFVNIFCTV